VHGIANLYIAGSSAFATCGYANPTFTVVALALRLADHLKAGFGGGP
jgi:choline dehydrogenase-like flavoprotein